MVISTATHPHRIWEQSVHTELEQGWGSWGGEDQPTPDILRSTGLEPHKLERQVWRPEIHRGEQLGSCGVSPGESEGSMHCGLWEMEALHWRQRRQRRVRAGRAGVAVRERGIDDVLSWDTPRPSPGRSLALPPGWGRCIRRARASWGPPPAARFPF